MGNQNTNQNFEFPQYLQAINQDYADRGYYRLKDKRNSTQYIGKALNSQTKKSVDEIESIIEEKLENPSPFVTELVQAKNSHKEAYCSDYTLFHLLYKSPEKTLAQQIYNRKSVAHTFSVQEIDNMINRTTKGLKYLNNIKHGHGKISTYAIQWPSNNKDIRLIDEWALNSEDTAPLKACSFHKSEGVLGEQEDQFSEDLLNIGSIGMDLLSQNYNPKFQSGKFQPLNEGTYHQERLKKKLQTLCDKDPSKRFQIYQILENEELKNFCPQPEQQIHQIHNQLNHTPINILHQAPPVSNIATNIRQQNNGHFYHHIIQNPNSSIVQTHQNHLEQNKFANKFSGQRQVIQNQRIQKIQPSLPFNRNKVRFNNNSYSNEKTNNFMRKPQPLFSYNGTIEHNHPQPKVATTFMSPIKKNSFVQSDFYQHKGNSQINKYSNKLSAEYVAPKINFSSGHTSISSQNLSTQKSQPNFYPQTSSTPTFNISSFPKQQYSSSGGFNYVSPSTGSNIPILSPELQPKLAESLLTVNNKNNLQLSLNQNTFGEKELPRNSDRELEIPLILQNIKKEFQLIAKEREAEHHSSQKIQQLNQISSSPFSKEFHKKPEEQIYELQNEPQNNNHRAGEQILPDEQQSLANNNNKNSPSQNMYNTIVELSESANSAADQERQYVVEEYQNGSKYVGYKSNNMRNGKGKFYYQQGSFYDGQWKNNNMHGYGKLYYSNNKLAYEGQWYMDQFHGKGKVYNDEPQKLFEEFDYTNFENLDEQWNYYEGTLVSDSKEGYGTLVLSNGQKYEGGFQNDNVHGRGKFYTSSGQVIDGIWKNSILEKQL